MFEEYTPPEVAAVSGGWAGRAIMTSNSVPEAVDLSRDSQGQPEARLSLPMALRNGHADLCDRPGLGGSAV
jgi:hypothetical protein